MHARVPTPPNGTHIEETMSKYTLHNPRARQAKVSRAVNHGNEHRRP